MNIKDPITVITVENGSIVREHIRLQDMMSTLSKARAHELLEYARSTPDHAQVLARWYELQRQSAYRK